MRILLYSLAALTALPACTQNNLNTALGTPKNPTPTFQNPRPGKGPIAAQNPIVVPLYNVVLEASTKSEDPTLVVALPANMRRYLAAGFALSDVYCTQFFVKTDEAYRRRRFGRTLTNDVGTVMTTILGLANAGEKVVTGLAGAVGFADSAWRNYDDSFVVSPDLSNIQSLVFAAQDNFRARTLATDDNLPTDYGTAQSAILRYSNFCSFLGMKGLLDQSAGKQKNDLNSDTDGVKAGKVSVSAGKESTGMKALDMPPAGAIERPDIAQPSIAPNKSGGS